jgi:hypothetical protein
MDYARTHHSTDCGEGLVQLVLSGTASITAKSKGAEKFTGEDVHHRAFVKIL